MSLFQEKKVEAPQIYEKVKLEELTPEKGDSVLTYIVHTPMFQGDDGEFMVIQALLLDKDAQNEEELLKSAKPISFPARSIIERQIIEEKLFGEKDLVRLEMNLRRGDTYKGKKVRYYAWDVYVQEIPQSLREELNNLAKELEEKGSGE